LETTTEQHSIHLSDSNSMLPDTSPILSDSLLSDTILPELPAEIFISKKSPKRKRGRPKREELLEDSSTHQSNSDIENVSSPSSLDSPMIGDTFDPRDFDNDDDDDESIYDEELSGENSNSNSSPIRSTSPQSSFVQDDSPQKKPRGRPRKKQENESGSDTSSELPKKKRYTRKIDIFEENSDEFSKSKKKRRSSIDYGKHSPKVTRVRVRV